MSESQIRLLFAGLEKLSTEVMAMRTVVNRAASNSALVLEGYQDYGMRIEKLQILVEKLRIKCPLLKPETNEFKKVGKE